MEGEYIYNKQLGNIPISSKNHFFALASLSYIFNLKNAARRLYELFVIKCNVITGHENKAIWA